MDLFNFPNGDVFEPRNKKHMLMLFKGKMSVDASLGTIKNVFARHFEPPVGQDEAVGSNMEKKAFFSFAVDFENTAKDTSNVEENSRAVQVTVSKFKLYLEPQSIEHAFKIYINYKSAFEYFTAERQKRNLQASAFDNFYSHDSTYFLGTDNRSFVTPSKKPSSEKTVLGTSVGPSSGSQPATPGTVGPSVASSLDLNQPRLYFLLVIQDLAICVPLEAANKFVCFFKN